MARVLGVAVGFGLVLASSNALASPDPGGFSVSISAEFRRGSDVREWAGLLTVSVPLGRFAAPRLVPFGPGSGLSEGPNPRVDPSPPRAPLLPAAAPAPAPRAATQEPPAAAVMPTLTPSLARNTVLHALSSAGYIARRARLSGLSARARSSAVLPELGFRTSRSSGQTLRLTPTTDDPYRYTQAGTSELSFEARLTWHLARLVFADEELVVERLQQERDAAERRLVDYVLDRLLRWQRGRARASDPNSEPDAQQTAELEAMGAAIELDVLTQGWFSQAIGESVGEGAGRAGEPAKVEVDTPGHAR